MHNPFIGGSKNLFMDWKCLRNSIKETASDLDVLANIAHFWSLAPLSNRIIDWDAPISWPKPWELLHNNLYDESAVSLGIFYTLHLADEERWSTTRCKLILVRDTIYEIQRIVCEIDSRWLLNLDYNSVVDRTLQQRSLIVQQTYTYTEDAKFLLAT